MRLVFRFLAIHLLGLVGLTGAPLGPGDALAAQPGSPPYPSSQFIAGMEFAWLTHKRLAPGSDNWPITWAADDHQYTVWGDGGGFGGTVRAGRAQARGGTGRRHRRRSTGACNVWGGYKAEVKAQRSRQELRHHRHRHRALSRGAATSRAGPDNSVTARSGFSARPTRAGWTAASWDFRPICRFYCPTFLQFGKAYAGARDAYVYMYAAERTGDHGVFE